MSRPKAYRQGDQGPPPVDAMNAYLAGTLPDAEVRELEQWMEENPEYRDALDGLREIRDPQAVHAALYRMRKSVRSRLDAQRQRPEKNGKPRQLRSLPKHFIEISAASAAAVGVLLMSIFIILEPGPQQEKEIAMAEEVPATESPVATPESGGEIDREVPPPVISSTPEKDEAEPPSGSNENSMAATSGSATSVPGTVGLSSDTVEQAVESPVVASASVPDDGTGELTPNDNSTDVNSGGYVYGADDYSDEESAGFGAADESEFEETEEAAADAQGFKDSDAVRMGNSLSPEEEASIALIDETDPPVGNYTEEVTADQSRKSAKAKSRKSQESAVEVAKAAPQQPSGDLQYGQASRDSVLGDLFDRAVAHYDAGEYEESEELLNEFLLSRNLDPGAHLYRGRINRSRGEFRNAVDDFRIAEEDELSSVYYLAAWELALAYLDWDKEKKAIRQLERIIEEGGPYASQAEVLLDSIGD